MRLAALAVLEESSEDNEEPANNANGVVDANESGEETESDGPEATAARRGDDAGSDAEADGTEEEEEEEDICLVCCEVRDPDKILRCSNCSGGGSGMGIYHNECLPKPLDSMPAEGEWVCPRCVAKKRKHGGSGAGGSKSTAGKNKAGGEEGGSNKTAAAAVAAAAAAAAAAASKKRKVPSREDAGGGGGGGGADGGGEERGGAKKPRRAWSASMEALLATAVKKMGAGKWKEMEEDPEFDFEGMPANALKQKWRTLSQKRRS
ncbi:unnamed protein product [Ectocarpus sp. 8 AP-2014]